jgi:hypothetical protein
MEPLAVALIGGLAGGTIAAIVAGLITLVSQSREHAHGRTMARDARTQDRRNRAYEMGLVHAYRLEAWVDRTSPVLGPAPDPPPLLPDEDMFKLNALTAAHASDEVKVAVSAMSEAARKFQVAAWRVAAEREHPGSTGIKEGESAWTMMEAERTAFREALRAFGDRVNEELRS